MEGTEFVNTDVWVSMAEPDEVWEERITLLSPYQVNTKVVETTGNPYAKFLYFLAALLKTAVGDAKPEAEGQADMVEGKVQNAVGGIRIRFVTPKGAVLRAFNHWQAMDLSVRPSCILGQALHVSPTHLRGQCR